MATWYVDNSDGRTFWQANHAYSLGDRCCVPSADGSADNRKRVFECTTGGTSGGSAPAWNTTVGQTTNDNSVVWTCREPSSWANSHPSLFFLLSYAIGLVNGDVIKVHDAHNEIVPSDDGQAYFDPNGIPTNPIIVVCVDKDDSDALSTGAVARNQRTGKTIDVTTAIIFINMQLIFDGNWAWSNGVTIMVLFLGVGTPVTALTFNGASSQLDTGNFSATPQSLGFINADIKCSYAANFFELNGVNFEWNGGSIVAPNGVTALWRLGQYSGGLFVEDVNLDAIGANELIQGANHGCSPINLILSRCKLPASWTGIMDSDFSYVGYHGKIKLHHCSSQNRVWEFYEKAWEGLVEASNSIYRSGGASDGVTSVSWKMASSANVDELGNPLKSPEIALWNSSTSQITLTVHGVLDSATNLQDDEVWIEVSYPADASSGLGTFKTTRKLAPYETASDLPTSTETWNGTGGMSNPNRFKLATTFTPGKAGPITARVCIGKASTTLYVCPKIVIS